MSTRRASTGQQQRAAQPADEVARLWSERDPADLASDAARHLTEGTTTDWGLSGRAQSTIPTISLGGGIPDPDTLPRAELLDAMRRALAVDDDSPLRYGGGMGYEPLRAGLAERYTRDRGLPVEADSFMVTNGSAGAIDLVARTLLNPGDVVISEAPTFSGSLRTFRGCQAEIVPVAMDEHGLRTDELETTMLRLASEGKTVKFIYTIANYHNPTGVALSLERRHELLRIASEHGAFILDDDAYGEIYFAERPPPALSALGGGYGVITVGTFSKIMATGLRVGWVHARPEVITLISRLRFDMGNSPLLLHTLARYMESGQLDEHLDRMRPIYAKKLDILASTLREHGEPYFTFVQPEGGFFLWVRLREGLTVDAVQEACLHEAIACSSGRAFFPDRRDADGEHLRLAYSWTAMEDLRAGAERLVRACARAAESG